MSRFEYTPNERPAQGTSYATEQVAYGAFFDEYWGGSFVKSESKTDKVDDKINKPEHPLLKQSGEPIPEYEAAHFNGLSTEERDKVRRAFDHYNIPADTPLTTDNMSAFMHNLANLLGSDEKGKRDDAILSLSELGVTAIPALVKVSLSSSDLQVRKSANELINAIKNDAGRRQVEKEHDRLASYEKDRKEHIAKLGFANTAGAGGSTSYEQLRKRERELADSPDAKLSPDLARLESVIDGSKKHLLETAGKKGSKEYLASVSTRADAHKKDIDSIRKMSDESAAMKAYVRLSQSNDLLWESFGKPISVGHLDEIGKLVLESLKNPRILQQDGGKADYLARIQIKTLEYRGLPAETIKQLENAYLKAGGDSKKLRETTHYY